MAKHKKEKSTSQLHYSLNWGFYCGCLATAIAIPLNTGSYNMSGASAIALFAGIVITLAFGIAASIVHNREQSKLASLLNLRQAKEDRTNRDYATALEAVVAAGTLGVTSFVIYQLIVNHDTNLININHSLGWDITIAALCLLYATYATYLSVSNAQRQKKPLHTSATYSHGNTGAANKVKTAKYVLNAMQAPKIIAAGGLGTVGVGILTNNIPTLIAGAALIIASFFLESLTSVLKHDRTVSPIRFYGRGGASLFAAAGAGVTGEVILSEYTAHQSISFSAGAAGAPIACAGLMVFFGLLSLIPEGYFSDKQPQQQLKEVEDSRSSSNTVDSNPAYSVINSKPQGSIDDPEREPQVASPARKE